MTSIAQVLIKDFFMVDSVCFVTKQVLEIGTLVFPSNDGNGIVE